MKHLPKISIFYWVLIVSANTLGETSGDLISQTFNLGYDGGTILLLLLFSMVLMGSIYTKNQKPLLYWLLITLSSTLGTTISDYISRSFFHIQWHYTENQGYLFATLLLIAFLALLFGIWRVQSMTNIVENGLTKPTEIMYWIAILTSSTLGTAVGDLLAHDTPLGFDGGTLVLFVILVTITVLYFITKIAREVLYWSAIIFTHPIGATMGDYLTKPEGFNLGNSTSSLILVVVFFGILGVGYITKKRKQALI